MLLSPSALAAALLAEEQPETAATQRQLEELQAGEHSPSTLSARMRLLQQGRQTTQRERTLQRHLQEEASAAQSHPQTVGGGAVPQQRDSNTDSIQGTPTKKHPAAAATNTIAQSPLRGPPPLLIVDTSRPRPLSPWWSLGDGEENGSSGLVCPHEPGTSLWRAWVHECHSVFFRWYSFGRYADEYEYAPVPNRARQFGSGVPPDELSAAEEEGVPPDPGRQFPTKPEEEGHALNPQLEMEPEPEPTTCM
jgi:hypothetical protein